MNKKPAVNKLYMAGGGFSGLTSQTLRPLYCGSDTISLRNPARPHTSDRYHTLERMRVHIIIFGLILSWSSLFGQTNKDCKQILKKEISLNDLQENIDQFVVDFQTLIFCEFDSIDYQIFMGPQGNMPLVAQSILAFGMKPKKKEEKFTFNDLKETLEEFKQHPEYFQARKVVEAKNDIVQRIAKTSDWNTDKELLIKMGFTKSHLGDIYAIVKENESTLYSDIFLIYSDTLMARKERQVAEKELNDSKIKLENPELEEWIKGLYAYKDYELGLTKSKKLNKPVLLYFNGYGCVKAHRIESEILTNGEIQAFINNKLIFVSLIVDERVKLEDSEVYFSKTLNKEVKTTGQKRLELEMKEFNSDRQPLFVMLDSSGKEISRIGYTNDLEEFDLFLKTIEK